MIAMHTTAISLPSEGETSGSCCPKKVSSDHNTGQITLKFHFYAVWVFVNSPQKKKLKIPNFIFLTKWGGWKKVQPFRLSLRCHSETKLSQAAKTMIGQVDTRFDDEPVLSDLDSDVVNDYDVSDNNDHEDGGGEIDYADDLEEYSYACSLDGEYNRVVEIDDSSDSVWRRMRRLAIMNMHTIRFKWRQHVDTKPESCDIEESHILNLRPCSDMLNLCSLFLRWTQQLGIDTIYACIIFSIICLEKNNHKRKSIILNFQHNLSILHAISSTVWPFSIEDRTLLYPTVDVTTHDISNFGRNNFLVKQLLM